MLNPIPFKNLKALNWIMSSMSSVIFFIFFLTVSNDLLNSVSRSLQSFAFMGLTSFCNLGLLKLMIARKQKPEPKDKMKFYFSSYGCTILTWLLVKNVYSLITHTRWEGDGAHVYRSYLAAFLAVWILNTIILFVHNLVISQHRESQGEIENLQLKANLSESANLLLRQQIHPHFLFNALNTVKSLYKRDHQQGEDYLMHLANFLRVTISNHTTKTTVIKNELEVCLDYLKMQKIRFGTALEYTISISEESRNTKSLPYFSLQPLVENSLKHNDLTEESPMLITIREIEGYIYVSNNLQPRNYKVASTGQGLSNLAERYRLLGENEILINSDDSFFTVGLKML